MAVIEENKKKAREYLEVVVAQGQVHRLNDFVAEDVVNHQPISDATLTPEAARGFDGFRRHVEAIQAAFPDMEIVVNDLIAERDEVVARFTLKGTHKATFFGIPPTGKRLEWESFVVYRYQDGKIVERWAEGTTVQMLKQLGVMPDPDTSVQRQAQSAR